MSSLKDLNGRQHSRKPFIANVDLDIDAEIISAMSVDISDAGVRIDMGRPLTVSLRFVQDGNLQDRKAQLAWARKTPDGGMSYGFEYVLEKEVVK